MAELNLTAKGTEQEHILAYLKENASDVLTEKINNGVYIEKDGKRLLSKKTLDGFMQFACDEARKQTEKGARAACIEDATVFGWAIHYFEEDTIEGRLFNEDGTEFNPVVKPDAKTEVKKVEKPKPTTQQASLFDMFDATEKKVITEQTDDHELIDNEKTDEDDGEELNADYTPEEIQEILAEVAEQEKPEPKKGSPMYQHYMNIQAHYPDSIIAYRLGDFYEVFGDNAVVVANELDLTLTGRDCGLDERVPMIGFPFHAADVYIAKIIQHGHKVAVAEDLNTVRELTPDLPEQVIDTETGEVLSHTSTPSESDEDILAREREIAKAFDKETLIKLSDLLGDIFTLE